MKSTCWDTRATDSIIKSGQKDTEASIISDWCMVLLYSIWRGFEAIVMFGDYSDSLVFLLIHSFYTTAEPAQNRSLTNFLKSAVM